MGVTTHAVHAFLRLLTISSLPHPGTCISTALVGFSCFLSCLYFFFPFPFPVFVFSFLGRRGRGRRGTPTPSAPNHEKQGNSHTGDVMKGKEGGRTVDGTEGRPEAKEGSLSGRGLPCTCAHVLAPLGLWYYSTGNGLVLFVSTRKGETSFCSGRGEACFFPPSEDPVVFITGEVRRILDCSFASRNNTSEDQ